MDRWESKSQEPSFQLVFIRGIMPRCGTNYLYELIKSHPDCSILHTIGEDQLLQNLHLLNTFVRRTTQWWRPLDDDKAKECRESFHSDLLKTVAGFMGRYRVGSGTRLVLKTPNCEGLSDYESFPDSQLVLLVRDGRDTVESAIHTGWPNEGNPYSDFDFSTKAWKQGALNILNAQREGLPFYLLKYELLVQDPASALRGLFDYLGVDPDVYPYKSVAECGVIGSSVMPDQSGKTSWQPKQRPDNFNPVGRWRSRWTPEMIARFDEIAGQEMAALGYKDDKK